MKKDVQRTQSLLVCLDNIVLYRIRMLDENFLYEQVEVDIVNAALVESEKKHKPNRIKDFMDMSSATWEFIVKDVGSIFNLSTFFLAKGRNQLLLCIGITILQLLV